MKISKAIETLTQIKDLYGDISITGGYLGDHTRPRRITVTDSEGAEVWPRDPNGLRGKNKIDGVFIE